MYGLDEWRWPDFTRDELKCRESGECRMQPEFMDRLQKLRDKYGKPMVVTSGYRSPAYNAKVSTTGLDGAHVRGRAVDIAVKGTDAYLLISLAIGFGFTGIGVKQHGASRFIHLDDLTPADGFMSRPWVWSY